MPTGIEMLWHSLETSPKENESLLGGWWMRLALPTASCPLFAAVEIAGGRRALLLRLPRVAVPVRRHWVRCKGLETVSLMDGDSAFWGVVLKEPRFKDVFAALADDLIRRVASTSESSVQVKLFLGQLDRWQKFLAATTQGLSLEEQRGLWGELHVFQTYLLPALGTASVAGWKGPDGAEQDFQFERSAIEVKTTLARQPQVVRISSERQLDDSVWPRLFLCIVAIETRDGASNTLPALVASLRAVLVSDGSARECFEDALLSAGYLDAHAERYLEVGYIVRKASTFRVKRGFPRILEKDLPAGVGDVGYGLSISACDHFAVSSEMLSAEITPKARSKRGQGKQKS